MVTIPPGTSPCDTLCLRNTQPLYHPSPHSLLLSPGTPGILASCIPSFSPPAISQPPLLPSYRCLCSRLSFAGLLLFDFLLFDFFVLFLVVFFFVVFFFTFIPAISGAHSSNEAIRLLSDITFLEVRFLKYTFVIPRTAQSSLTIGEASACPDHKA